MNIAQVNAKMAPERIIAYIQRAAGLAPGARAERNYNVKIGAVQYKLRNDGRVEKTIGGQRTARNWATLSANERQQIVNAVVPQNMRANYNAIAKEDKYNALLVIKKSKVPSARPLSSVSSGSANSSLGSFAANLEREMEWGNKLRGLLGNNYYKNENVQNILARINALPSGARGGPKKANVNKVVKNFVREKVAARRGSLIRSNFEPKIKIPNWLPANKHAAYKKTMMNLLVPNAKGKYPAQKNIKEGMRAWLNAQLPKVARAAYNKENMLTGEIIHVPAWNPPKEWKFNVPKRLSPPKPKKKTPPAGPKKPRVKADPRLAKKYQIPMTNNVSNLGNAMLAAKLNIWTPYSWNELARAGVNNRFKNTWLKYVASN
jgi:hypothetical protein